VNFYVRVLADFWKVFGTVVYFYIHKVVADWPNAVCLLFVRKIGRWKPVKYDRLCWLCLRIYAQQLIKWLLLTRTTFAHTHTLAPVPCTTSCLDVRRFDANVWWLRQHLSFRTATVPESVAGAGEVVASHWPRRFYAGLATGKSVTDHRRSTARVCLYGNTLISVTTVLPRWYGERAVLFSLYWRTLRCIRITVGHSNWSQSQTDAGRHWKLRCHQVYGNGKRKPRIVRISALQKSPIYFLLLNCMLGLLCTTVL